MSAHLQIVAGNPEAFGYCLRPLPAQFKPLKEFGVFGFKSRDEASKALAQHPFVLQRQVFVIEVRIQRLHMAALDASAAVAVDDGVSEELVEPGDKASVVTQLVGRLDRS